MVRPTDFQKHMWRRYGFMITGKRGQEVKVLEEKGGGCHPASYYELFLWRAMERLWNKTRKRSP